MGCNAVRIGEVELPYQEVTTNAFSGLNLRDDPRAIGLGAARDLSNVALDVPGTVRSRDGTLNRTVSGPATGTYKRLARYGNSVLLGVRNTTGTTYALDTIDSTGLQTQVGATFSGAAGDVITRIALIGTKASGATAETTLAFIPTGSTLRKYDGTAHAASVGEPVFVCAWTAQARLVQAKFLTSATTSPTGANGSPSTVFFSDAGAPETYGATNYVHLRPGDGESIQAVVPWRELVFVFKHTAVFIFTSTSVDATGNPVFSYRTIDLPDGLVYGACAGDDGVYFTTDRGLYVTRGDVPVLLSDIVGTTSPFSTGLTEVNWANGRIYLAAGAVIYVFDTVRNVWLKDSYTGVTDARSHIELTKAFSLSQTATVGFCTGGYVHYYDATATTDPGGAFTASYSSGSSTLGSEALKVVRGLTVAGLRPSGNGNLTVTGVADGTDGASSTVTLTTGESTQHHRVSAQGRAFGYKLSGSDAWRVKAVTFLLRNVRGVGMGV